LIRDSPQWAPILANMMIEGMMGLADYECARLLGNRYFRLAPVLPTPLPLDCADKIDELIGDANQVDIMAATNWLKANFENGSDIERLSVANLGNSKCLM
jgi:hypothetical protein